jgi:hypothetical protein
VPLDASKLAMDTFTANLRAGEKVKVQVLDAIVSATVVAVRQICQPESTGAGDLQTKLETGNEMYDNGQQQTFVDVQLDEPMELVVNKGEQTPLPGRCGEIPLKLHRCILGCAYSYKKMHPRN